MNQYDDIINEARSSGISIDGLSDERIFEIIVSSDNPSDETIDPNN